MATRYYARGKRVASESTGVYGDEWVCTMDGGHDAKWMAEQLNKAQCAEELRAALEWWVTEGWKAPGIGAEAMHRHRELAGIKP